MIYEIEQVAAGDNWRIKGPGMQLHDRLFSRDDAMKIAQMLARAFVKGQESVLASERKERVPEPQHIELAAGIRAIRDLDSVVQNMARRALEPSSFCHCHPGRPMPGCSNPRCQR